MGGTGFYLLALLDIVEADCFSYSWTLCTIIHKPALYYLNPVQQMWVVYSNLINVAIWSRRTFQAHKNHELLKPGERASVELWADLDFTSYSRKKGKVGLGLSSHEFEELRCFGALVQIQHFAEMYLSICALCKTAPRRGRSGGFDWGSWTTSTKCMASIELGCVDDILDRVS